MKATRFLLSGFLAAILLVAYVATGTCSEAVIVDGYNITASVSGTPLKDAYQDYFKMGVGLNGYNVQTDTVNSRAMTEIIKYHFNSATYSNLMKPAYLLDQAGSIRNHNAGIADPAVRFDSAIRGLEFCKNNGIQMRGHVLVWHNQTPDWFFRAGYTDNGKYVDRETMLARLESYIRQVLEFTQREYPGVIYAWDVVNEAVENTWGAYEVQSGFNIRTRYSGSTENPWYKVIGVDYVEKAFEFARKYAGPDVKLFYNDYNTFQPTKTQSIYKLASHLKAKGLIDGIGMQGYMDLNYPGIGGGRDSFKTALAKFAELGLEIHITELSITTNGSSEELFRRQAERYEDVFRVLTELDTAGGGPANITSVTVFGLMDNYLLYDNDTTTTRLFDGRLQPKPAFYSVLGVGEGLQAGAR
ncbi:MAG: endo-1,4-beta-xylanase [Firmicutes bacterium]|nr:endo-1,4-beta-xylanase [Bacillota bacterium]